VPTRFAGGAIIASIAGMSDTTTERVLRLARLRAAADSEDLGSLR